MFQTKEQDEPPETNSNKVELYDLLNRKLKIAVTKSMYLWIPCLQQRRQGYTMEKRQPLLQVVLGKLVNHL